MCELSGCFCVSYQVRGALRTMLFTQHYWGMFRQKNQAKRITLVGKSLTGPLFFNVQFRINQEQVSCKLVSKTASLKPGYWFVS